MNFSAKIKKEIIDKGVNHPCCKKAFLAGFIRSTGSISKGGNSSGFECSTDSEPALGYAVRLFKEQYSYVSGETYVYPDRLNKKDRFSLECVGEDAVSILFDLGILAYDDTGDFELRLKSNKELLDKECCIKAFIKGMFIGSGHCTLPDPDTSTGYHLEVVFTHKVPASDFAGYLARFGIFAKTITRRKSTVVYIKSAEEISDFLALVNAPKAVLKITDTVVEKQLKNNINRQKNCDIANVTKQVLAYEKHLDAIRLIEQTIGLNELPEEVYKTAIARKENPDDTLSELAEKLQVTKSCLNHRLRKILAIAEELK